MNCYSMVVNYINNCEKNEPILIEDVKEYVTGAALFNQVGLTTQVPNFIDISTNECKNYNKYINNYFNTIIRKPKIEITTENYKYLQLFDLIENKDNINIEE